MVAGRVTGMAVGCVISCFGVNVDVVKVLLRKLLS